MLLHMTGCISISTTLRSVFAWNIVIISSVVTARTDHNCDIVWKIVARQSYRGVDGGGGHDWCNFSRHVFNLLTSPFNRETDKIFRHQVAGQSVRKWNPTNRTVAEMRKMRGANIMTIFTLLNLTRHAHVQTNATFQWCRQAWTMSHWNKNKIGDLFPNFCKIYQKTKSKTVWYDYISKDKRFRPFIQGTLSHRGAEVTWPLLDEN